MQNISNRISRRRTKKAKVTSKVFVWGLNDKNQLGPLEGSKIKLPVLSKELSSLQINQIAGGSKTLFAVTSDGKVRNCNNLLCWCKCVEASSIPPAIDFMKQKHDDKTANI